jgi:hypothetical protein
MLESIIEITPALMINIDGRNSFIYQYNTIAIGENIGYMFVTLLLNNENYML